VRCDVIFALAGAATEEAARAKIIQGATFLTFKISDEILAPRYGYPLKLRIPTKLGFKNPKWITAIFVTNRFPGVFWEDRGYNWFAGV
jgi:DMSO/TMAO reductase YedYZ molybdopterin-dependent catalytic subunit